jgi:hypothetical protein
LQPSKYYFSNRAEREIRLNLGQNQIKGGESGGMAPGPGNVGATSLLNEKLKKFLFSLLLLLYYYYVIIVIGYCSY